MYSFVISMDKFFKNFGIALPYMYPYMKEKNFQYIFSENEDLDVIFKEIKFSIQNNGIKDYQILYVISAQEELICCGGNLTNKIKKIEKEILKRLKNENLPVKQVNFLVLDGVQRDFNHSPKMVSEYVSENLDRKGYTDIPYITDDELVKIEKWCEESFKSSHPLIENEKEERIDYFSEKIEYFFKNKEIFIEDMENSVAGSAIFENIKHYRSVKNMLIAGVKNIIRSGKSDSFDKGKIDDFLFNVLTQNNYFYNYLFSSQDLEKLKSSWGQGPKLGNNQDDLSTDIVEGIENFYQNFKKEFFNIVEKKEENIKKYKKYTMNKSKDKDKESLNKEFQENIYIADGKEGIKKIKDEFEKIYYKNYLKEIIEKKSLKSEELKSPVIEIKNILSREYALRSINLEKYNILKYFFNKKDDLKFNENTLSIAYLIQFFLEYSKQNSNILRRGIIYNIDEIELKTIHNNMILDKYRKNLEKEVENVEAQIQQINNRFEIKYFKSGDADFNADKSFLSREEIVRYDKWLSYNEINSFNEWNKKMSHSISEFILQSERELSEYQMKKMRLKQDNSEEGIIKGKIEFEIDNKEKESKEIRNKLIEIEKEIDLNIKNNWLKTVEEKGLKEKLKTLLDRRMKEKTLICLVLLSMVMPVVSYGFFKHYNLLSLVVKMAGFALATGVIGYIQINRNKEKIEDLLKDIRSEYNSYTQILDRKLGKRKDLIDAHSESVASEKNNNILKTKKREIGEKIAILTFSRDEIKKHLETTNTLKVIFNSASHKNGIESIRDYETENQMPKIEEKPNYEKPPFENFVFIPSQYCEIAKNREIQLVIEQQILQFQPENIFGCSSIKLIEDRFLNHE